GGAPRLQALLPVGDGRRRAQAGAARRSRAQVDSRRALVQAIEDLGVVAVIRMRDAGKLQAVIDALREGGVRAIEVTMTVPDAVSLIRRLAPSLPPDVLLGAGTVVDAETARAVIDAGARYVVSPVFRPDVIAECHKRGAAAAPGCFTPTE